MGRGSRRFWEELMERGLGQFYEVFRRISLGY